MALDLRKVGVTIAIISLVLAGLILVQSLLLNSAYRSKQETFRRNTLSAMGSTIQRLTASEAFALAIDIDSSDGEATASVMAFNSDHVRNDTGVVHSYSYVFGEDSSSRSFWVENDSIHFTVPKDQHVSIKALGRSPKDCIVFMDTFAAAGSHSMTIDANSVPQDLLEWEFNTDDKRVVLGTGDNTFTVEHRDGTRLMRMITVQSVLNRLDSADQSPIQERIKPNELDSLLMLSLKETGIDMEPMYGISRRGDDSLLLTNAPENRANILLSDFHMTLFPLDFSGQPNELRLYFPNQGTYIWWQMAPLLLPTVLLTMIIIAAFAYTIRTIIRQRRFADTLVEFVNNMTHEFKTPISTVQLACEAISREEISNNPERVKKFNNMILSESRRMKDQSDKILQMALLEKGEYELHRERLDINELIQNVIDTFRLRADESGGQISSKLNASRAVMNVDPTYFTNILHNLLDNAVKYSKDVPEITVSTFLSESAFVIAVSDNGIGIARKERNQVFERYFRVNQEDRHDVKGFGLGLSFVKLMVEAHGGQVSLESELSKGTVVSLIFPAELVEDATNG